MPELSSADGILSLRARLERDRLPYCLATVVRVDGSASAKPGAKMVVSAEGRNLWGWVGGGCAESFTCENAVEALAEGKPRLITARLDDEVFGLGMPCGGSMQIFVEPVLPPAELALPLPRDRGLAALAERLGFLPRFERAGETSLSPAECVLALAAALARSRGLETPPSPPTAGAPPELLILGHSRITQELAAFGVFLGWPTRVYGLALDPALYPPTARALPAQPGYAGLEVRARSFVIVASHHKGDHHYVAEGLRAGAAFLGMVASRHRAGLVLEHLRAQGFGTELARVEAPVGWNLGCRNPGEIALSIAARLLTAPSA